MIPQQTKCNEQLGKEVNDYLVKKGVQTPMKEQVEEVTEDYKINNIKEHFRTIMELIGLDLNDDSLTETPARVAKMFVKELYWGLKSENFPKCTTVQNKMKYDEMVIERDITSMSSCEHHFVTIDGKCHIGYIPKDKVLGLSKLNRVTEYFSRRPQIQERLTEQIFFALEYILGTSDIAIVMEAVHYCVKSRGIEDKTSSTITSKLGGKFKSIPALRAEFMNLIRK